MTTLYQYTIYYYKVGRKRNRYFSLVSPYFAFSDICIESMKETLQMIISNDDYKIDNYYTSSVLVDTVDGLNVLTVPESALPF